MDFVTMIASAHPYLDRFDYDHYPDCFAEFEENCARWFTEHEAFLSHQMINPAIGNFIVHYPFDISYKKIIALSVIFYTIRKTCSMRR